MMRKNEPHNYNCRGIRKRVVLLLRDKKFCFKLNYLHRLSHFSLSYIQSNRHSVNLLSLCDTEKSLSTVFHTPRILRSGWRPPIYNCVWLPRKY